MFLNKKIIFIILLCINSISFSISFANNEINKINFIVQKDNVIDNEKYKEIFYKKFSCKINLSKNMECEIDEIFIMKNLNIYSINEYIKLINESSDFNDFIDKFKTDSKLFCDHIKNETKTKFFEEVVFKKLKKETQNMIEAIKNSCTESKSILYKTIFNEDINRVITFLAELAHANDISKNEICNLSNKKVNVIFKKIKNNEWESSNKIKNNYLIGEIIIKNNKYLYNEYLYNGKNKLKEIKYDNLQNDNQLICNYYEILKNNEF